MQDMYLYVMCMLIIGPNFYFFYFNWDEQLVLVSKRNSPPGGHRTANIYNIFVNNSEILSTYAVWIFRPALV